MHWFEQLAALYGEQDIPLFHDIMLTAILIDVSSSGQLVSIIKSRRDAIIPVTEVSACRTHNIAPHPLCDTVQNLTEPKRRRAYLDYLAQWARSPYGNDRLNAVLRYMQSETLAADLALAEIEYSAHSMIRFAVDGTELCGNAELISMHISYTRLLGAEIGVCSISGEATALGTLHPKRIVSRTSSAKLISGCCGDKLCHGRFNGTLLPFTIGRELSFKAHAVLKRLISQGGLCLERYTFIAFDESGTSLPLPLMGETACPHGNVTLLCFLETAKGRLSVALYRQISCEHYRLILQQPYIPLPQRHRGYYYERFLNKAISP